MPGFDQTGPEGRGALTGRQMGKCTNYGEKSTKNTKKITEKNDPEDQERGYGRGRKWGMHGFRFGGRGRGGRGRGNRFRGNIIE